MTYASVADITSEFKNITIDGTSNVSDTEVTEFLAQAGARINMSLAGIYEIPIAGAESLEILRSIEIAMVSWRVWCILDTQNVIQIADPDIPQTNARVAKWKIADKELERLHQQSLVLPDAVRVANSLGLYSYTQANNICPEMKKGVKQW